MVSFDGITAINRQPSDAPLGASKMMIGCRMPTRSNRYSSLTHLMTNHIH